MTDPNIANPRAAPSVTTTYVLTTSNSGGGCVDTDTVVVAASVIDSTMQLFGKASYCVDSDDTAVLRVAFTDSIQWYRDGVPIRGANQASYRVRQTGTYHAMLRNNSGCSMSTAKQKVSIDLPRPPSTYPTQYAVIDLPFDLKSRTFGATVLWSPGINLDNPRSQTPVFKGSKEQLYTITIVTSSGCITVDTQLVRTVKFVDIVVPNAFTPNNDGKNDYLRPILMGISKIRSFKIFNRWGQLLFESNTDRPGWDGTFKGNRLATQTVVWMAEGIGVDGKTYLRKGTSVLGR